MLRSLISPSRPAVARLARLAVASLTVSAFLAVVGTAVAGTPARYKTYDSIFDPGKAQIPGHDSRWVPQGLAYWGDKDALIISYYDSKKELNSRLAVIDRASGKTIKYVVLAESGHVGGVATAHGDIWVSSSGHVTRYAQVVLSATKSGALLPAAAVFNLKASSYVTTVGRKLIVGDYYNNKAYRYTVDKKGRPHDDGVTIYTPAHVQGLAIVNGNYIFSRSGGYGHDADSTIQVMGPAGGRSITAPNMSEDLAVGRGELFVVYESASSYYDDADFRVRTVHHGPVSKLLG